MEHMVKFLTCTWHLFLQIYRSFQIILVLRWKQSIMILCLCNLWEQVQCIRIYEVVMICRLECCIFTYRFSFIVLKVFPFEKKRYNFFCTSYARKRIDIEICKQILPEILMTMLFHWHACAMGFFLSYFPN